MTAENPPHNLPFLGGYPEHLREPVRLALAAGRLGDWLAERYPDPHQLRSDAALWDYAQAWRQRQLRNTAPLAKVAYDNRLQIDQRALGTLTAVSRVQGGQLKAKREIRIAAVFRDAPAAMLDMILAHELSHLKEREHDKAFYALCQHLLPGYHQVEFDTRVWLTWRAHQQAMEKGAAP